MSGNVGPVCHIPPNTPVSSPSPKNIPGVAAPASATLPSLQSTVNNLRQIVMYLTGQQGPQGQSAASQPARWSEKPGSRITTTTRVYQNNDPTSQNWVDVRTIQSVTMADGVTGESWIWKRGND